MKQCFMIMLVHSIAKSLLRISPNARLVLTGHSSGAIYAAYAALDIMSTFSTNRLGSVPFRF